MNVYEKQTLYFQTYTIQTLTLCSQWIEKSESLVHLFLYSAFLVASPFVIIQSGTQVQK